jgi:pimeloyl-ACP methyl ester carboxylesterase
VSTSLVETAVKDGFAVVQSAFSETGWALDRAVYESELLRQHFIAEYGAPKEQYVSGHSMGGALTLKTIELEPEIYNGAMDFCGPLQPTYDFMQARTAQLAAFEYYFPGLLPKIAAIPADYEETAAMKAKLKAAVEANPAAQEAMETLSGLKGAQDLADKASYAVYIVKDYTAKAGGQPFDNRNFVYVGTKDDAALNRGVERYAGNPVAAQFLMQYTTPTGNLQRPMIEMHTLYDRLIPAGTDFWYANQTMRAGHSDNFVLQYVERSGHCNFTPAQEKVGFEELLDWVHNGKKPLPGLVQ